MIYNFDIDDVWYDIPVYPGYQINRDGIVRSMKFMYYDPGKIMNTKNGKVTLSASGKKKVESIFNLLNITFFENRPVQNNNIDYSSRTNDKLINGGDENKTIKMDFSKYVNG